MSNLSVSLFVKEPGKTRTLILTAQSLEAGIGKLSLGDSLKITKEDSQIILVDQDGGTIGRIENAVLSARLSFALSQKAELKAIFVRAYTSNGENRAEFILKCSLPIFADEKTFRPKPFVRGSEPGSGTNESSDEIKGAEEKAPVEPNEEDLTEEETNPLAGLNIVSEDHPH